MPLLPEEEQGQQVGESPFLSERAERAKACIFDAFKAFEAAGVQAASEDIRSFAITMFIEGGKAVKVAGISQAYNTAPINAKPAQPEKYPSHVPVQQPQQQAPQNTTGTVVCPHCGNGVYDNRTNKTNPKGPDYKCRNKACSAGAWEKDGNVKWGKPFAK